MRAERMASFPLQTDHGTDRQTQANLRHPPCGGKGRRDGHGPFLRETGTAALAHAEALAALLKLELKEASKRLGKKTALLLMGAFMAFFGYLFLWCLLTVVMAYFWGIIAGLAVTTGFHLLAAATGFILFSRTHVTPIAPATAEELKTDLSCLQMALKKSSHS